MEGIWQNIKQPLDLLPQSYTQILWILCPITHHLLFQPVGAFLIYPAQWETTKMLVFISSHSISFRAVKAKASLLSENGRGWKGPPAQTRSPRGAFSAHAEFEFVFIQRTHNLPEQSVHWLVYPLQPLFRVEVSLKTSVYSLLVPQTWDGKIWWQQVIFWGSEQSTRQTA